MAIVSRQHFFSAKCLNPTYLSDAAPSIGSTAAPVPVPTIVSALLLLATVSAPFPPGVVLEGKKEEKEKEDLPSALGQRRLKLYP